PTSRRSQTNRPRVPTQEGPMRDPERAEAGLPFEPGSATRGKCEGCRCGLTPPDRAEVPFTEAEEPEHAAELIQVGDSRQFDAFLGGLIQRAARAAGGVGMSRLGSALGGLLKGVARSALPGSGVALGGLAAPRGGVPGGSPFESETGGVDTEEQKFEA